eukprot:TRINITY_DN1334_c0_g1_i1.p1 TRINITY_DN1334_c0_g1~~TRINITY_DN1334_c0_g1_i1.p1  ORF type:complete len:323 (+),score=60.77 TRINITY_DN1334_c0_g1_i1:71-1039(+)
MASCGVLAERDGAFWFPWRLRKRRTPILWHTFQVSLFFVVSVFNAYALQFDVGVSLHTIFRSAALVASIVVGVFVFGKKTSVFETICMVVVTIGISEFTYETSIERLSHAGSVGKECDQPSISGVGCGSSVEYEESWSEGYHHFGWIGWIPKWWIGLAMMTLSISVTAFQGHLQEYLLGRFGKDWKENVFYTHLLAAPMFVLLSGNVVDHLIIFSQSSPLTWIPGIPRMWIYLALNVATQLVCIRGVYLVLHSSNSLTTNLVTTVRKFISFLISAFVFHAHFTWKHWTSALLVFGASTFYVFGMQGKKKGKEDSIMKKKKTN